MSNEFINIALCDDNIIEIKPLEALIVSYMAKYNIKYKINFFKNGNELLKSAMSFHIIFMDIEFVNSHDNGIDIARKIRKFDSEVNIIFISNNDSKEYIKAGYKAKAIGFISKPIKEDEFFYEFDILLKEIKKNNQYILDKKLSHDKIYVSSILYVEFINRKSLIVTSNSRYSSYTSLKEWNDRLSDFGFAMSHKSYLINLDKINKLKAEYVEVENIIIPVSRTYRDIFREHYYTHLRGKL